MALLERLFENENEKNIIVMNIVSLIKSLKPYRREHWIILSILLYSLVGIFQYYIPGIPCNILICFSSALFIFTVLRHRHGEPFGGIFGFTYMLLIVWSILLTFHMFFIADVKATFEEYHGITTYLLTYFVSYNFFPNLLPFMLLIFPRNYRFDFSYFLRVMWLLCILYLCYYPFAFWNMTHYSWSFDAMHGDADSYGAFFTHSTKGLASLAPAVIMIFWKKYLNDKKWKWFTAAYVGSVLVTAYMARRGDLAMALLYIVLAWGLYSFCDKRVSKIKMIVLAIVCASLCFVLFTNLSDSFFSVLMERAADDSRTGVEESFYADMKSNSDWIFGRGWFGQYFESLTNLYRTGIETGFLTMILRGGLLYLLPYLLLLGISFVKGVFFSHNLLCKSLGLICLMQIISLYPFGWPAFNFFHFTVWMGVWLCNTKRFRMYNDKAILSELNFKL